MPRRRRRTDANGPMARLQLHRESHVKRRPVRRAPRPRPTHSTVPSQLPPPKAHAPKPPRVSVPKPSLRKPATARPPKRQVARVIDDTESTLLDVIDNLLAKGVMLNADLILALADVDLVYVRLSALLCAADRVLPRR